MLDLEPMETKLCMNCHAPLAEQHDQFENKIVGSKDPARTPKGLAGSGIVCAACHLRQGKLHGPPKRDTVTVNSIGKQSPHGQIAREKWFEDSAFCSACHQFPLDTAVNGKPIQNTYEEWKTSPQAKQGITCQTCHMPDRQHLWRGIHDMQMVESGLTPRFSADKSKAKFEITNTGVGHAFPTYVIPKVTMHIVLVGPSGGPIKDSEATFTIQRQVEFKNGKWVELSDTRLLPGQTAGVSIAWQGSSKARMWLEVRPGDFYGRNVFPALLKKHPKGSAASQLLAQALKETGNSKFVLFEKELDRLQR